MEEYSAVKYIDSDMLHEMIALCYETKGTGTSFRRKVKRSIDAFLHKQSLEGRNLYNPYRNLYLDHCYGDGNTPLSAWMDFFDYVDTDNF